MLCRYQVIDLVVDMPQAYKVLLDFLSRSHLHWQYADTQDPSLTRKSANSTEHASAPKHNSRPVGVSHLTSLQQRGNFRHARQRVQSDGEEDDEPFFARNLQEFVGKQDR